MKRIIVVDDDPPLQDAFKHIFPSGEYDLIIFNDGSPILREDFTIPDLFILDKQLTGVDGLEVCRVLKEREATKNIPVIILSASPNIRMIAELSGADFMFEKPFELKVLRDTVSKLLSGERPKDR